ncbi:HNH endonuclease [Catellatospora coxensis]|uniref:HNH endonuclease n=1 Tax=Catellatospora coxensis TaxID=310354 RepID=A0A8J3PCP0_9ACTN|nr:hypothetical protein [Catellatospora coxensis]GIG10196.1 hypothetical protein Cco03nite_68960 [Catellatospora coxensis]
MTTVRNPETGLREQACECSTCHYCGLYVAPRHEHDHFPVPKARGGTEIVPACMNCHELKDRAPFHQWHPDFAAQGIGELLRSLPGIEHSASVEPVALVRAVGDHRQHWSGWTVAGRLLYATVCANVERAAGLRARTETPEA